MGFWDVLPTLAEIARVDPPKGIDGASFLSSLEGRPQPQHTHFYWEFHEGGFQQAVRQGDWKLVRQLPKLQPELFNLREDLSESRDLAGKYPDILARLSGLMRSSRVESQWWPTV